MPAVNAHPATRTAVDPGASGRDASHATANRASACHMWYCTAVMKTSRWADSVTTGACEP